MKVMPETVISRLLDDEKFSSFLDVPVLSCGDIGSFRHEEILSALERARSGSGKAELSTREGRRFVVTRLPNPEGVTLTEGEEAGFLIPEFSFLDPEQEVRLETLAGVERKCWPGITSVGKWRSILAERPLREIELARIISDIRETPNQFFARLKEKWSTGVEMCAADFFPTTLAYYSLLIGPPPDGHGVSEWIDELLVPELQHAISLSLDGGLKRVLALNVDQRLSPSRFVAHIPAVELLPVMGRLVESESPIALLGILEIALVRTVDDVRFFDLALDALNRLLGKKLEKSRVDIAWKLIPALIRVGLGKMSVAEELSSFPPFWRRLGAFAHAHFLVELFEMDGKDVDRFIDWLLGGLHTRSQIAANLLDISQEPLWIAWDFSPRLLRASVFGRLMSLKTLLDGHGLGGLVDSAAEELNVENVLFHADRPGPLIGNGMRMSGLDGYESTDSESMTGFFSQAMEEIDIDPISDAWKGMSVVSRLLRFDEVLLDRLAKVVGCVSMEEEEESKRLFFEALLSAADVAATQPFEPLGDSVASALIRETNKFTRGDDVVMGYRILMLSSGAIKDRTRRMNWMGNRMSDYAFGLPRGEACRCLLYELDVLQTLLPIRERCFGRARKFVAAGMIL